MDFQRVPFGIDPLELGCRGGGRALQRTRCNLSVSPWPQLAGEPSCC